MQGRGSLSAEVCRMCVKIYTNDIDCKNHAHKFVTFQAQDFYRSTISCVGIYVINA